MTKKGTYMWIQEDTKKRLDELKEYPRQSYNTVIENFLNDFEQCRLMNKKLFLGIHSGKTSSEESEREFESFLSSLYDMIFVIGKDDKYTRVYGGKGKNFYVEPSEFIGKKVQEVMPPEVSERYEKHVEKARKTGKTQNYQYMLHIEGREKWFEVNLDPYSDGETVIATVRDITKRRKKREQLENLLKQGRELYYFHGTDNVIKYVSNQSKKMFGYSPEEMEKNWNTLLTDNPINKECFEKTKKAIETGEKQSPYIVESKRKDGTRFFCEINETPVKDEDGNVLGMAGLIRDITGEKKTKEELEKSSREFKKMQELLP